MAQSVLVSRQPETSEITVPQIPAIRYENTIAQGNSRNVYGNVINTYYVGPQQAPTEPVSTLDVPGASANDIECIMKNLEFEQMDERLATVATAHLDTCQWLFQRKEYMAWRDPDASSTNCGFLWLKGKPGAGKSTLMKSAQRHGEEEHEDLVISFFFNARGVELQKSTQGMYRSLLHQLLGQRTKQLAALSRQEGHSHHFNLLASVLEKARQKGARSTTQNWPIEQLKNMLHGLLLAFSPARVARCADALTGTAGTEANETFKNAVLAFARTPVACYVDALDECEDDEARDVIEFLGFLRAAAVQADVSFRVLLSSRHYPYITFDACQDLIIESQEGHEADIAEYLRNKLRIGKGALAREIRLAIQARASGVFLWVVLVVRIMNDLYDRGKILHLRQRLSAIPSGLHQLFEDIVQKDIQDGAELLLVSQLLLFSREPLRLVEFYYAMTVTSESFSDFNDAHQASVGPDDMLRFLLNASKGLAEITKGERPTVQFIHESVKDYLLGSGLVALAPSLATDLVRKCHLRLHQCCYHYLANIQLTIGLHGLRDAEGRFRPSFFVYAVEQILYHAEAAGLPLDDAVAVFRHDLWQILYNLKDPWHPLTREASPLYIFIMMGALKLAEAYIEAKGMPPQSPRQVLPEYHRSLLGPAIANRDYDMVKMLLGHGIGANWPAAKHHTCLTSALSSSSWTDFRITQALIDAGASVDPDANDPWGSSEMEQILRTASKDLRLIVLKSNVYTTPWHLDFNGILRDGNVDPEVKHVLISRLEALAKDVTNNAQTVSVEPYHSSALVAACVYNLPDMVALLVKLGVDVNVTFLRDTVLSHAVSAGHTKVVQALLELGASPSIPDHNGNYPVQRAVDRGDDSILRTLLEYGADASASDECHTRPLYMATERANETAMRLLIEHKADVNGPDLPPLQPLIGAVARGHASTVRFLIDHGADVSAIGEQGPEYADTCAFFAASRRGYLDILDILLAAGDPVPIERLDKAVVGALDGGFDEVVARLVQKGARLPLRPGTQ